MTNRKIHIKELGNACDTMKQFLTEQEMAEADAEADAEIFLMRGLQEEISKFVTSCMAEKGLGLRGMARELEISPTLVSKIINGYGNITLATITHIAAAFRKKIHFTFE